MMFTSFVENFAALYGFFVRHLPRKNRANAYFCGKFEIYGQKTFENENLFQRTFQFETI